VVPLRIFGGLIRIGIGDAQSPCPGRSRSRQIQSPDPGRSSGRWKVSEGVSGEGLGDCCQSRGAAAGRGGVFLAKYVCWVMGACSGIHIPTAICADSRAILTQ
jgi:hypothetical protein